MALIQRCWACLPVTASKHWAVTVSGNAAFASTNSSAYAPSGEMPMLTAWKSLNTAKGYEHGQQNARNSL